MYQVSIQRDDREGREDREEVELDKGDLEVQQNPPVAKRTWLQTAAAAGVLAMVREGEALGEEEIPSKKKICYSSATSSQYCLSVELIS